MKRFLQVALPGGLIVISALAVIQWQVSEKVRRENQLLAAEVESMKSLHGTTSREHKAEISKAEQEELLRLRSEVSQLRGRMTELEQLRRENQILQAGFGAQTNESQARWKLRVSELRTNEMMPADFIGIVAEMAEALTNSDPAIRSDATKVLRRIGLTRLFETNLTEQNLADLKSAAIAATPGLLPLLKDSDVLVCANAAITLGFLRENPRDVVPALMENLTSDQWRIAGSAARALGRFQGDASSAVPALLQLAQSSDPNLRETAIEAVKQIDPVAARNAGFQELP
jgi:HEAT repeat protein